MAKNINKKPYDDATVTKLEIFEQYLLAWLPVFIQTPHISRIRICDYFAGSGQDSESVPGSPLRILRTIEQYRDSILKKYVFIDIVFNEADSGKLDELKASIEEAFNCSSWHSQVQICFHNEEFQGLFDKHYEQLKQQPNLLFVDQYGVKEVTGEIFQKIIGLEKTDFLFFVSSSAMKRFAQTPEFQAHFPDILSGAIRNSDHESIHRAILNYYKEKIPTGNKTKLYPFSLKKGGNVYGLVFGSKHPLGVEKFLDLAWDKNRINGEANFDIDRDLPKQEPSLFDAVPDYEKPKTKREKFELELEEFIQRQGKTTNRDIYYFTLEQGHPKSHARECLSRLKREGKVVYKGQIGFSYKSCVKKEPKIIEVTNNG